MIPKIMDDTKSLSELVNDKTCIGRLAECTSAIISEERNGAYTLELEVPMSAKYYSELHVNGILKVKANQDDDEQLFRIESISEPYGDVVTVNANHISYDLSKVSVLPCTAIGADKAVETIKSNMLGGSSFEITTTWQGTTGAFKNLIPQPARSLFGGQSGSLIDVYGGEWHFDNLTCNLMRRRGTDRSVQLRYGKNITSIEQETNIESMYTHVQPYSSVQDANAIVGTLHELKNVSSDNMKIYNLDLSDKFSDLKDDDGNQREPTVAEIDKACDAYIKANDLTTPKVSIELEYVNLADIDEYKDLFLSEKIALCDTVHVYFPKLNINASAKVVSSEWNVLKERYEKLEIGDARSTLASTVADISSEAKEYTDDKITQSNVASREQIESAYKKLDDEMSEAITKIKSASGGKTVLHDSTDDSNDIVRNELYAYDGDTLATSNKVLRINNAGIAGTDDGINGTYHVAITTDGYINADYINAGTLTAIGINGVTIASSIFTSINESNNNQIVQIKDGTIKTYDSNGWSGMKFSGQYTSYYSWKTAEHQVGYIGATETDTDKFLSIVAHYDDHLLLGHYYTSERGTHPAVANLLIEPDGTFSMWRTDVSEFSRGSSRRVFWCDGSVQNAGWAWNGKHYGPVVVNKGMAGGAMHSIGFYWTGSYLGCYVDATNVWSTSDKRYKKNVKSIADEYIDAIGEVDLKQFNFKSGKAWDDSIKHFGVIAQDVREAFNNHGLDVTKDAINGIVAKEDSDDGEDYYTIDKPEFLMLRMAYNERRIAELEEKLL